MNFSTQITSSNCRTCMIPILEVIHDSDCRFLQNPSPRCPCKLIIKLFQEVCNKGAMYLTRMNGSEETHKHRAFLTCLFAPFHIFSYKQSSLSGSAGEINLCVHIETHTCFRSIGPGPNVLHSFFPAHC